MYLPHQPPITLVLVILLLIVIIVIPTVIILTIFVIVTIFVIGHTITILVIITIIVIILILNLIVSDIVDILVLAFLTIVIAIVHPRISSSAHSISFLEISLSTLPISIFGCLNIEAAWIDSHLNDILMNSVVC